ncbi:hypothetical protein QBC46DRAFT_373870 [Diplogelasinospora grovesii]|uniref:Uncharacterized protein n=1 Tax=Diplogelasinospora grovesii TaxID=303347 RepID=A0AAN6NGX4_9PEZI|nr:hypothetical protein QBC46DRAFT_373870 [Diplogelasinospora grovesii]
MLDENLPSFRFKPSSDKPLSTILYFTQNGSDPAAEYVLRRADPSLPESRNRYATALCDAYNPDVVYAELMVEPEWSQPTLSAAEIRAQREGSGPPAPASAVVPPDFTIQLYNPDQSVSVKMSAGGWNKSDSWEFEMPQQSFKMPSKSELDREHQTSSPADLSPRIVFRWKKDSILSKDMTCYMTGKNLGGRKSKEPDITIALFKAARESAVTVYEPNLQRVEVEDRKGLELVLLLGAEAIKDLYLMPKVDVFNVGGGGGGDGARRRQNSRPTQPTPSPPPGNAMSGAILHTIPPTHVIPTTILRPIPVPTFAAMNNSPSPVPVPVAGPGQSGSSQAEIDAETRRLQAMVEREEKEREKREKAEQKRIKKMLEEEEKERRKRDAEVAKETERLKKMYGVEGQDLPSGPAPALPPRQQQHQHTQSQNQNPNLVPPPPPHFQGGQAPAPWNTNAPPPQRPVSAGPSGPFGFSSATLNALWHGPAGNPAPPPHMQGPPKKKKSSGGNGGGGGMYMQPAVAVTGFFGGGGGGQDNGGRRSEEEKRKKMQKKRSMHW